MCRLCLICFFAFLTNFLLAADAGPLNEPPVITGQNPLQVNEDDRITVNLDDLIVSDPDNNYPEDFTLSLYSGNNYTLSGSTVIPDPDFSGTLTVPVTVNDGDAESSVFDLSISVVAVNDPPVITGQLPLSTNEDQPLEIAMSDLLVSDPDNSYPSDFTLEVSDGDNYSVQGSTVTPDPGYNGVLKVPVSVRDGEASSAWFDLRVDVVAVNNVPVITGQQTVETDEEKPFEIRLSHLVVEDDDNDYPEDFTLSVSGGSNYQVDGNTVIPDTDFNGTLYVPVVVDDGQAASEQFSFILTVTAVNDKPVITGHTPLNTPEDTPITLTLDHISVADPDNIYPADFTLQVDDGDNYSVSGTTVTPDAGFSGTLQVPVRVNDGIAVSDPFNVQVQVSSVNNAPEITGQQPVSIPEDESFTIGFDHLTVSDPDNDYPSGFTISVSAGSDYSVDGTTILPVRDFNGVLKVPVTVNDGSLNSAPFEFTIEVLAGNDPPVITGQNSVSTEEDQSVVIALSDIIVQDVDNVYPEGFSLSIEDGANYTVQGNAVLPSVNYSGNLSVGVRVSDGNAVSDRFDLAVTVHPVNDSPQITGQAPLSVAEESDLELRLSHFTVQDPDNNFPADFALQVHGGQNYLVTGTTIRPAADFSGTLTVGITVSDGSAASQLFNAQVSVVPVNDRPVITGQQELRTDEDVAFQLQLSHLVVADDNAYPQGFTLKAFPGDNYTVEGTTIKPAKDFYGTLQIPVSVHDGSQESDRFGLQLQVSAVNDAPRITGQKSLTTLRDQSFNIKVTDLIVEDPDNVFPEDFNLEVGTGPNYHVFQMTITPVTGFTGTLQIPVTVDDGLISSPTFMLNVVVEAPPNVKPVITSQVKLTTYENEPITLLLNHLVVTDPDNVFPDDFTLKIYVGNHYTLNGNIITPEKDYYGTLSVKVTVSDGKAASDPYIVKIDVLPVSNVPLITSQAFLKVAEDDSIILKFADIYVSDPDDNYPAGFTMTLQAGSNYTVSGLQVTPTKNFNGYLSVPVTVSDGENTSAPYQLLILVDPVNDPPELSETEAPVLYYSEWLNVFADIDISDVDDDSLAYAEATIAANFEAGKDSLWFSGPAEVRSIFDRSSGTMVIFGSSGVSIYRDLLRGIVYGYSGNTREGSQKELRLTVSDGKAVSDPVVKVISFDAGDIVLDIPGGFTPNGDGTNDTWSIRPVDGVHDFGRVTIRVYNNRGTVVFESDTFETEWDGRLNGVLLPAASYFYTIDLHGGYNKNRYKGIVTLLR